MVFELLTSYFILFILVVDAAELIYLGPILVLDGAWWHMLVIYFNFKGNLNHFRIALFVSLEENREEGISGRKYWEGKKKN